MSQGLEQYLCLSITARADPDESVVVFRHECYLVPGTQLVDDTHRSSNRVEAPKLSICHIGNERLNEI